MLNWLKRPRPPEPSAEPFQHLLPGHKYRVVRSFVDHDGLEHPVGETWTFRHSTFLPYEDGRSLFVARDTGAESQIRLQHRPEAEGPILDSLENYLLPIASEPDRWALLLTRDSLCLAEDVYAPHSSTLEVARNADATGVAAAILRAGYLPWSFGSTWSLRLGEDQVVFGYKWGLRFLRPIAPETFVTRADQVERMSIRYWAQQDAAVIASRLAQS